MNVTFLKLLLSHCIVIISPVFLCYLGQPILAFDHLLYKEMQKKHFMQHLKIVLHISKLSYTFHLHLCVHLAGYIYVYHGVFSCNMCEKGAEKCS